MSGAGSTSGTNALAPPGQLARQALASSRQAGCVVLVEDTSECEIRFANNTTTTNGRRRDRRVTVISIHRSGAETSIGMARQSGDPDVGDLVRQAEDDATGAPPAPDAAPLLEPTAEDPLDDLDEPPSETDWEVLDPVVTELSSALQRARRGDRVLAGFAEHRITTTSLVTSTGLRRRHEQPTGALHLVGRDRAGRSSAWAGAGTPDFTDVTVHQLEEDVARRLDWAQRRVELEAGRYEVILPPSAVADLMTIVVESMGGRDAEEGGSVFSSPGGGTRVGERLSSMPLQLRSDPTFPGMECSPFLATAVSTADVSIFDNGLPTDPTSWLRDGVVERLVYPRAGATRSAVPVTPPVDNLLLELPGATSSTADLVASTERGLLLTCLWYIRAVDPTTLLLTGLTRDGVFLVEEGSVTAAVNNFRFNESPVDLLGRVTEVSRSQRTLGRELGEWFNRTTMPALRVPDFNMSSVSPAN